MAALAALPSSCAALLDFALSAPPSLAPAAALAKRTSPACVGVPGRRLASVGDSTKRSMGRAAVPSLAKTLGAASIRKGESRCVQM